MPIKFDIASLLRANSSNKASMELIDDLVSVKPFSSSVGSFPNLMSQGHDSSVSNFLQLFSMWPNIKLIYTGNRLQDDCIQDKISYMTDFTCQEPYFGHICSRQTCLYRTDAHIGQIFSHTIGCPTNNSLCI